MDSTFTTADAISKLKAKVGGVNLPTGIEDKINEFFSQLEVNSRSEDTFWSYYQSISKYLDCIH